MEKKKSLKKTAFALALSPNHGPMHRAHTAENRNGLHAPSRLKGMIQRRLSTKFNMVPICSQK